MYTKLCVLHLVPVYLQIVGILIAVVVLVAAPTSINIVCLLWGWNTTLAVTLPQGVSRIFVKLNSFLLLL